MKIPSLKRILREDLGDAPDWVAGIINPVNSFMEYIYQAMNRNITDSDNISCQIREITYITPSTYPVMENLEFVNLLKVKATNLQVMQIYDKATYVPPVGPVYAPWVEDNGKIIVYPITGLAASKTYILRLRVS